MACLDSTLYRVSKRHEVLSKHAKLVITQP